MEKKKYQRSKEGEERRLEAVRNKRLGKSYEEIYGKEKSQEIKDKIVTIRKENGSYKANDGSFKKEQRAWNYNSKVSMGKHKTVHKTKGHIQLSHINWCEANGVCRIPEGCIIHHIDCNAENNNPENLQLMDRRFHMQLHHQYNKNILLNTNERRINNGI